MRIRVKICGITNPADADAAIAAGADALGFNFHPASPRAVSLSAAASIIARLPPFVTTVGVVVDPDAAQLAALASTVPLNVLQFHGDEPEALCRQGARPYIKVFTVGTGFDIAVAEARYASAQAFLLDSGVPGARGGTGVAFDWSLWPAHCSKPLVLAGGLTPSNVREAIAATRPFAVDVCGGVEGSVQGCKDAAKVHAFIDEVRHACRSQQTRT
jgi:phosphoribosylanthranilate isomerase